MIFENKTIGFAFTGSFCSFEHAFAELENLQAQGCNIIPIMSQTAYSTDTRFGNALSFREKAENITQNKIIHTIADAEPIGPKKLLDLLIICPCTGNTMAKLALGVTDTSVTMAAKAHLRTNRPVLIAPATNDGLGASGKNITNLLNTKNVFFVPFKQDDWKSKPKSLTANFKFLLKSAEYALEKTQIQPVVLQ